MLTGELGLEQAARESVGNWQRFESFCWFRRDEVEDPEDWAIFYTHHRDSGLLDQSNAAVIRKVLEPFTEADVVFESHSHWAIGHIDGFSIRVRIADFSLLLATTDEHCLLQPLRDRMRLVLRFDYYSEDELITVLHHRSRALNWDVEEAVLPVISQRSRGTPRIALRLLQACRRVCRAEGESTIAVENLQRACELEGIDDLGLAPTEQKYLDIVSAGSNRLNVIASMLGLPTRTVSQVTEAFLIRSGLVVKDDQGRRHLTERGQEHLSNLRPTDV